MRRDVGGRSCGLGSGGSEVSEVEDVVEVVSGDGSSAGAEIAGFGIGESGVSGDSV